MNDKRIKAVFETYNNDSNDTFTTPFYHFFSTIELEDNQATPNVSNLLGNFALNAFNVGYGEATVSMGIATGSAQGFGISSGSFVSIGWFPMPQNVEEITGCDCAK